MKNHASSAMLNGLTSQLTNSVTVKSFRPARNAANRALKSTLSIIG